MRSPITTHVLDTARGKPAAGVNVALEARSAGGEWTKLAGGVTNADGRITDWMPGDATIAPGIYRATFDTGAYFKQLNEATFFPSVSIEFEVRDTGQHYHVPLLLSPYGYSTYRGS